jgi:hypothetical protein
MQGFERELRSSTDPASGKAFGGTRRGLLLFLAVASFLAAIPVVAHAAPIPGQYIVALRDEADADDAQTHAERLGAEVFARYRHALSGYAARMSDATLAEIRSDPRVRFVSPDFEVSAQGQTLPTGSTASMASSAARARATASEL